MLNEYQKNERKWRNSSYQTNLAKEQKITEIFIKWCKRNHYRFRINPTDSSANLLGSDVTISKSGSHYEIDIKGFRSSYDTVALSYERSLDGIHWTKLFNSNKITTHYVFIDPETEDIYCISYENVKFIFDDCEKVEVSAQTAGHYQKIIKIPIEYLSFL